MLRVRQQACAVLLGLYILAIGLPARSGVFDDEKSLGPDGGLRLLPETTVSFDTDEGSWVSPAVSPDGKTITFDLLGHLYRVPISGGTADPITSGMEFDSTPRYSPDGKQIVFVSDRAGADNIWLTDRDGSAAVALTDERAVAFISPTWTPDGQHILVSRQDLNGLNINSELWIYDVHGGKGMRISEEKDDLLGASVSGDGRSLYYARNLKERQWPYTELGGWQIAHRDLATGYEEIITQEAGGAMRPVVSPDGHVLVYGSRVYGKTGLRLRNLRTGDVEWLVNPIERDDQETFGVHSRDLLPGYCFTPDGRSVIIAYAGKIHSVNIATREVKIIPISAHIARQIGPTLNFPERIPTGPVRATLAQNVAFSPDGQEIAFGAFAHVYSMKIGEAPRRLTHTDTWEFEPSWSPDGKWIAYVTWTDHGGELWKLRSDGGGLPEQLSRTPKFYTYPVWSPDGGKIVLLSMAWQDRLQWLSDIFRAASVPQQNIVWISSSGGDEHLVMADADADRLHFSRDDNRIYFTSRNHTPSGAEEDQLVSVRLDGADKRVLFNIVGKKLGRQGVSYGEIILSPNGEKALALFRRQAYLLCVPPVYGLEAPTFDLSSPSIAVSKLSQLGADQIAWADSGDFATWTLGSTVWKEPTSSVDFRANLPNQRAPKDQLNLAQTIPITVEQPRYTPKGTVVLRGARIVTMKGSEVIEDGDVVITGGRISAVGKHGAVSLPKDATVVQADGKTIIPGFVDTHDHWFLMRHEMPARQEWVFLTNLAYGVTTGRDPQSQTTDIFLSRDLEESGDIVAPRLFSTGPGMLWDEDIQSLQQARDLVSRYTMYYKTNTVKSYLIGDRQQRQWVVEACKELHAMPTTEGAGDTALDLTHFIDGFSGNEHNFPNVPLYSDIIQFVAHSHTYYDPTPTVNYGGLKPVEFWVRAYDPVDDPKVQRFYPPGYLDRYRRRPVWARPEEFDFQEVSESAVKIVQNGGKMSIGGHGDFEGLSFQWSMWALSDGGLSPLETLRLATLGGAAAIGYEQDLGSIEVGKYADLLILDKNPLHNIRNTAFIRYVMKNGVLYDGNTLDEVWPNKRTLPPMWWSEIEAKPRSGGTDSVVPK